MITHIVNPFDITQFPKPFCSSKTLIKQSSLSPSSHTVFIRQVFRTRTNSLHLHRQKKLKIRVCRASSSTSNAAVTSTSNDAESAELFQRLKDAERERINKLEEFENKANKQLERQLVMASDWSGALLTMRGKLKGTEWDPENSHRIDFSEF